MRYTLRDYQERGLAEARSKIAAGVRSLVMVCPTGGGKTVVACNGIIETAVAKGKHVLFMAHRKELIEQPSRKLDENGITLHSIVKGRHWRYDPKLPIQVASVTTLKNRLNDFPRDFFDIIITDEAHHCRAGDYGKIYDHFRIDLHVGLTATPYRLDGKGMGDVFEDFVQVATISELIEKGHIVPFREFSGERPDLSSVHQRMGDYNKKELAEASDKTILIGHIINEWKKWAADRTTIAFCVDVNHSKHVAQMFTAAGIPAEHVDGSMPDQQRTDIFGRFESGKTTVLTNCEIATEGYDCPRISCVMFLRPTKSRCLWRQMGGRGGRPAPGKEDCVILDHAGCYDEHGSLSIDDQIDLADGVKKQGMKRKFVCPKCGEAMAAWTMMCPYCKQDLRASDKEEHRIEYDESKELVEMSPSSDRRNFYSSEATKLYEGMQSALQVEINFYRKFGVYPTPADKVGSQYRSMQVTPGRFEWRVISGGVGDE